jgi:hypothetical protein
MISFLRPVALTALTNSVLNYLRPIVVLNKPQNRSRSLSPRRATPARRKPSPSPT